MDIDYQTFEAGDFTCLPAMSNGCAASIGYIADHIPRKDSVVVMASCKDANGQPEVVGYILATSNEQGTFIHNVHVQEVHRRKKVATRLLARLRGLVVERHNVLTPINLFVVEENFAAFACYLACGFQVRARIPNCKEANATTLLMTR